jgi:hypothetical protein
VCVGHNSENALGTFVTLLYGTTTIKASRVAGQREEWMVFLVHFCMASLSFVSATILSDIT